MQYLRFSDDITFAIQLPHVPPVTYICRDISEIPSNVEHGFETRLNSGVVMLNNEGILSVLNEDSDHFAAMASEEGSSNSSNKIDDDVHCYGGDSAPAWVPTNWDEQRLKKKKKRMSVELGHTIFGHRAVSSLLAASQNEV